VTASEDRATDPEILQYAAFTHRGAGGNPAGVVLDASLLSDDTMLRIAADLGYSETAFVVGARGPTELDVRYFSPLAEVPFCGHATIATAVALAERSGPGDYLFHTRAGEIALRTTTSPDGTVLATLTSVPTHSRPATASELDRSLAALGWTREQLDPRYPPNVAFGGNDHLVLALTERATLAALDYDFDALAALMAEVGWITVHVVWAESRTVFHARDPFPPGGVVEDPATGAAAAAFGGYLRDLGRVQPGEAVTILQGFDHGTPSQLLVVPEASGRVRVTGTATRLGPRQ
jgi:PhzF family phenazine biosynthesis protein